MLHILNNLKEDLEIELVVAHVNHLVRKEAKEDEQYVEKMCEQMGIEFYSKRIDIQKLANNNKAGLEETGRKVRYEFFEEVLKNTNANKISIAHNKNDLAETVIMNILRGTGIQGLRGIELKTGKYIRPLLKCSREEIEEYCRENQLDPKIDKTNLENEYTRNKIRNIVIPYVQKEFNPNIIETLNRLSNLIKEEDNYLKEEIQKKYEQILIAEEKNKKIILDLKKFNNEEKAVKSSLLLSSITKLFGSAKNIEKIHIEDIIKLCQNNIGNKYLTPNKKTKILVKNHKITITKEG